jgi:hypothetical protein
MKNIEFWASLVGAIIVAFIIAIFVPGKPGENVVLAIEYGGLVITFLFGFMILAAIASGKIDISGILGEKGTTGGGASMSRFQLLIFTFVIALSLFLIVVKTGGFPKTIPPEILTLLGISATTYAVSKGIQAGSQSNGGSTQGAATTGTLVTPPGATGPTIVTPPGATGPTIVTSPGAAGLTIVTSPGAAGPTVVTPSGAAGPTVVTHPGAAGPTVVEPPPVDPG